MMNFKGYRRKDGCVGARNLVAVIPTVGCVNDAVGMRGQIALA